MSPNAFLILFLVGVLIGNVPIARTLSQRGCPDHACDAIRCAQVTSCPRGSVLKEDAGYCGCCNGCVRQLGVGALCTPKLSGAVATIVEECALGLQCSNTSWTCEVNRNLGPCHKRLLNAQGKGGPKVGQNELPQCDDIDGTFRSKQCHNGECHCVMKNGDFIGFRTPVDLAQNQTCACARTRTEGQLLGESGENYRCDSVGNFEPIQCRFRRCYCVDVTGAERPNMSPAPQSKIYLLNCD